MIRSKQIVLYIKTTNWLRADAIDWIIHKLNKKGKAECVNISCLKLKIHKTQLQVRARPNILVKPNVSVGLLVSDYQRPTKPRIKNN